MAGRWQGYLLSGHSNRGTTCNTEGYILPRWKRNLTWGPCRKIRKGQNPFWLHKYHIIYRDSKRREADSFRTICSNNRTCTRWWLREYRSDKRQGWGKRFIKRSARLCTSGLKGQPRNQGQRPRWRCKYPWIHGNDSRCGEFLNACSNDLRGKRIWLCKHRRNWHIRPRWHDKWLKGCLNTASGWFKDIGRGHRHTCWRTFNIAE